MVRKILDVVVEPVGFLGLFLLTLNRILWGGGYLILTESTFEKVFPEYISWLLVGVLFMWLANRKKNIKAYMQAWKGNWPLLIFILFATISIFWSDYFYVSLYKVIILIVCSAIASYIGITYPNKILIKYLAWFFLLVSTLSYGLALFVPEMGTNIGYPYFGAWRGFFTIKNYMGPLLSFGGIVYLFKIISIDKKWAERLASVCLYLLTIGLAFLSRSAAAIIVALLLNASFILVFAWVKFQDRLRINHYIIIGSIFTVILILALTQLNFLLGLFNRNTTFTGRVTLWSFIINAGITRHLWFGTGLGAAWASPAFRLAAETASGWDFAPFTGHNGLVDVFLNLGLVGVVLLVSPLLLCLFRVTRDALKGKTVISFFPAIIMAFVITSNITEDFILELETFVWFLLVYALFSTTLPKSDHK